MYGWTGRWDRVTAVTLDEYARSKGTDRIAMLKIDAEGWEPKVLEGAMTLLKTGTIRRVMVESNETCLASTGHTSKDVVDILRSFGFGLGLLNKDGFIAPCPREPVGD